MGSRNPPTNLYDQALRATIERAFDDTSMPSTPPRWLVSSASRSSHEEAAGIWPRR